MIMKKQRQRREKDNAKKIRYIVVTDIISELHIIDFPVQLAACC